MHTEENQSKGRKSKPGEQVAYNKAMHCNMQLFEDEAGEYYAVVDRMEQATLVRGEYYPIGNRLHYPKIWGRRYAATKLVQHIIEDKRKIIEDAKREIEKLERCQAKIDSWDINDM